MFARLCNPTAGRRFKLRPFSNGDGTKRRHSWGSLAAGAEVEGADEAAAAAERRGPDSLHLPARRAHEDAEDSSSEDDDRSDDEWSEHKDGTSRLRNAAQCLDLLETCWGLERARLLRDEEDGGGVSETESEPGPERGELESSGMGQRASSTSSLHVKPPTTTAPGRVSLTWALLKRQPSVHLAEPQHPVVVQRRASPARSVGRASSRTQTLCPDSLSDEDTKTPVSRSVGSHVSSRHRSHRNSDSNSLAKRFGYDIHDVDEFLSKASLQSPANIPVVLAAPSVLYQPGARRGRSGRGTWRQNELSLPLGMVVNAVFRSHAWLYVHTPHGEAGYVRYRSCLPLGILPQPPISTPGTPAPAAWDTHTDAFPPPPPPSSSRAKRGTTSVCDVRHRRNKTDNEKLRDTVSECGGRTRHHRHRHRTHRPEEAVDRLFLASQGSRAESECARYPSKVQSSLAHRTSIGTLLKDAEYSARRYRSEESSAANIDTVSVKDSVSQCGVRYHKQKYAETKNLIQSSTPIIDKEYKPFNKQNLDHNMKVLASYHYATSRKNNNNKLPSYRTVSQQTDDGDEQTSIIKDSMSEVGKREQVERSKSRGAVSECGVKSRNNRLFNGDSRAETLLLIRSDYNSRGRNTLSVSKGDVVVLVSGKLKDWFWVRRGDGCEGFIPSVVAGHGFL